MYTILSTGVFLKKAYNISILKDIKIYTYIMYLIVYNKNKYENRNYKRIVNRCY